MDEKSAPTPGSNRLDPQKKDQLPSVENTSETALTTNQSDTSLTDKQQLIKPASSAKVFISYAHADQELRQKLEEHLSPLKRSGKITVWQDQEIPAGANWQEQITTHLTEADIILLLVSASFLASKYCWSKEVALALRRHQRGEVKVIPVILRPTLWQDTPLGQLQALPKEAKPVTEWDNQDKAFEDVARGIRAVVETMGKSEKKLQRSAFAVQSSAFPEHGSSSPSSSVLGRGQSMRSALPSVSQRPLPLPQSARMFTSRRMVVAASGALVGVAAIGSVAGWLVLSQAGRSFSVTPTPVRTALPSPVPVDQLRVVRTLSGHTSGVLSVAISRDGQMLVSGSNDGTIKVWKTATGELVRTLSGHTGSVFSVVLSADGQQLFSGSADQTIKIWKMATGELVRTLSGHTGYVWRVTLSADGLTLVSGSQDRTIKIWKTATGELVRTLSGHASGITSVVLSADGQTLVSGSYDFVIKVWKMATGELVRTLSGHTNGVLSLALSADGLTLVSGSADQTIKVWKMATGELVRTLSGHRGGVTSVVLSADGQQLFSGSEDHTIKIWKMATGELVRTLSGHTSKVTSVALSADGQTLISGSYDLTIDIWGV